MGVMNKSWKLALTGLGALALGACATAEDLVTFGEPEPVACPISGILKDAEHVTRFKPGSAGLVTDVVLDADIVRTGARCTKDRDSDELSVYTEFLLDASLGPAASSGEQPIYYFVALVHGDRVLKKSVGQATLDFAGSARFQGVQSIDDFTFTPAPDFEVESYQVLVGFQLSEEQMKANRDRNKR